MIRATALALALTCAAVPAAQADLPDPLAAIEVLPGWQTGPGTYMAGLRITLAPGWKTYWRSPGAAGIPPLFDWGGSRNLADAAFHWPAPEVFDQAGMESIGYVGGMVLPVEVTAIDASGAPPHLAGSVEIGVCQDICIPVTLAFSADLSAGAARDPAIVAALVDRPLTGDEAGAGRAVCTITPTGDGLVLTLSLDLPPLGGAERIVVETADPGLWVGASQTSREGPRLTAQTELIARDGSAVLLDRSRLRFTVLGTAASQVVELQGCQPPG